MDSHGTSAEGVDSDGGGGDGSHRHSASSAGKPRPITNNLRIGSFPYDMNNIAASSGSSSTSCTNSTLSSPTGSGANVFSIGANIKRPGPINVSKRGGGELVRKRSRESMKSLIPGEMKAAAPSPKKSNLQENSLFTASFKQKDSDGRLIPGMVVNRGYVPNMYHASSYPQTNYGASGMMMPGPLPGLTDDLRLGMDNGMSLEHVQDFFFPDDPSSAYNRSLSSETEHSNPQYYYPHMGVHAGGLLGHEDDGLLNLLDNIDWDMEPSSAESAGSTSTHSRPLSPLTDTASSVGSCPSSAVALRSPKNMTAAVAPVCTIGMSNVGCAMRDASPPSAFPTASTQSPAKCDTQAAAETVQPQHRMAFSSVIDELKLMKEVVTNAGAGAHHSVDPDHITLFNLFQRDGAETVGRLPPLRSLVQRALGRIPTASTTNTAGIAASRVEEAKVPEIHPTGISAPLLGATGPVNSLEFDEHDFDFSHFMNDDFHYEPGSGFDNQAMQVQCPSTSAPTLGRAVSGTTEESSIASHDLFCGNANIMDSNGSLNAGALLSCNMLPNNGNSAAPGSKTGTPSVVQRKRGRPRKHSISVPNAPVSTPSATATAKALLSGPALVHALSTQQYQGFQSFDASMYNTSSAAPPASMAFSAPSGSFLANAISTADYAQNARSYSGDSSYSSLRHSPNDPSAAFNPNTYFAAPDIRSGMTRTMSSESDTMLAATFDPKLYDALDYGYGGMGMLEDFE